MRQRPRISLRQLLLDHPLRPPNSSSPRAFTQNTIRSRALSRPQLPFLSSPSSRPSVRFLTTERKQWIKSEIYKAGKWTVYLWTFVLLGGVMFYGVEQEWIEHLFPTPADWTWFSRRALRDERYNAEYGVLAKGFVDWNLVYTDLKNLLQRLEDPKIDGAGLEEQGEGGILVAGIGRTGYDISKKSEPWRRGYYETMMAMAQAAEHMDDFVFDTRRRIAFPKNTVIGPSNPDPRPVPPGAYSAPREEDCEATFDNPEVYYTRLLTTRGLTEKQRVDAALAYGAWLDYKQTPEAALEMYKWALDIATSSSETHVVDRTTGVLNVKAGSPSENILAASTALAIHHALNSDSNKALPIFLSVLRARRSLADPPPTMRATLVRDEEDPGELTLNNLSKFVRGLVTPKKYPPAPSDGTSPPTRTPKERCEEAGIMAYIGEIIYAAKASKTGRDEGLAWTREAVDVAEEELRGKGIERDAKKTCRQCLEVGLDNWAVMVAKLAKQEKDARAQGTTTSSWLGFGAEEQKGMGRWESEELVVMERFRRARDVLMDTK